MKNGNIPFNKGKKGYMSAEQYEKCKQTMFKKGNIPANHRPIGSERVGKDGYILIKIYRKIGCLNTDICMNRNMERFLKDIN